MELTEDGVGSTTLIDFPGRKSDALSAVKLDPAVLDAQVTVISPEGAGDQPDVNRSVVPRTESKLQSYLKFKEMVLQQEAALLSLTPQQMDLLMKFADTLRRQREDTQKQLECSFCKNNGEAVRWYSTHCFRDARGRVRCPVARSARCALCGATGDRAHTINYCPDNVLLRRLLGTLKLT